MRMQLTVLGVIIASGRSRRIHIRKEAQLRASSGFCNHDINKNCECFRQMTCSSCTLPACPLQAKAFDVSAEEQGLTGTTWKLLPETGQTLMVKFQDFGTAVLAAQLAHQLAVPTPRALVVSREDCPALFDEAHAQTLQEGFFDDIKKNRVALLQEYVDKKAEVLPGCDMRRAPAYRSFPWVQVGIIAMFDWLTGKPDLFNDWQVSVDELNPQNRHNIIARESLGKAVDIDLQISRTALYYKNDFINVLDALTQGRRVEWVRNNVLHVLQNTTFGRSTHVQLQVELGLAYGLRDILQQSAALRPVIETAGGPVEIVDLMLEKSTVVKAEQLVKQLLKQVEPAVDPTKVRMVKCCKVECSYETSWMVVGKTKKKCTQGPHIGHYVVNEPLEGCEWYKTELSPIAVGHKCGPVCNTPKNKYVTAISTITMQSSCS